MKPRIVVHTPEPNSGAARYVWELVSALTAQGVHISLVCPKNVRFISELESNPGITLCLTRERSTDTSRNMWTRIVDNAIFLASSLAGLTRAARRGDLVHFQFVLHFPFGALFFLLARLRGCKVIFTVHDPLPHHWLLPFYLRWLEQGALKWAYQVSHRLIVHSEPGKKKLVEYFHQNPAKISVIAHGPYELGSGIAPMAQSDTLEILVFGSIRENKGIHLAIEAVQALSAESAKVRLTIAGEVANTKEQPYWNHCLSLIRRSAESIRVMQEFVPDEKLGELFGNCHCVLLPYTEFFSDSGVAQMALSNGRPILATRSGGLAPLLNQGDLGIPIESLSKDGVREAIRVALHLGLGELERRGQNGAKATNQEARAWKAIAKETNALYLQQIAESTGPDSAPDLPPVFESEPGTPTGVDSNYEVKHKTG